MRAGIAVIGSANVDFIIKVERLPDVGETVTGGEFLQAYGGKGANQAVAAARAGAQTTFVTCLGEDVYAPIMLDNFRRDNIVTDRILRLPNFATGSALIMVDRSGQNFISVAPGANYALEPRYVDDCFDLIRQSAMLVMQMEIPVSTTLRILELAARSGIPVLFNYAPAHTHEIPVSSQMHGLIVNENEASQLTGLPVETLGQASRAAKMLLAKGPQFVVLTLGAAGAYAASADLQAHIPTFKVMPVDTTAAGDVFCGALAVALVEGKPLLQAVQFANAASALSVTRMGAQPSIPQRAAIEAFLQSAGPAV